MAKQKENVVIGADIGTLNKKDSKLRVLSNGQIVVDEEVWSDNLPETLMLPSGPFNCWSDGVLTLNMTPGNLRIDQEVDAYAVTGMSGSALMLVDLETGLPLLAVYGKPSLMTDKDNKETIAAYEKAGIPKKADRTYMYEKARRTKEIFPELAALIGRPDLKFNMIGIEPVVTAYARMLAGIDFGEIGFGPHEYKGASGIPGATAEQAKHALREIGYDDYQFTITNGLWTPEHKVYVSGDFPELLSHIIVAIEQGALKKDLIMVETDSHWKIYTKSEIKLDCNGRYNDLGFSYHLNRNGSVTNAYIQKFVLPKYPGEKSWYQRADDEAGNALNALKNNQNPYFYLPGSKLNELGALYKLDKRGKPKLVKFENIIQNGPERSLIISALYAGAAAELRFKLDQIKAETGRSEVALHGGFIKMDSQVSKRIILSGMLQGFDVSLLDMPDPSTLAGISAASNLRKIQVDYRKMMTMKKLGQADSLNEYYKKWLEVRDQLN